MQTFKHGFHRKPDKFHDQNGDVLEADHGHNLGGDKKTIDQRLGQHTHTQTMSATFLRRDFWFLKYATFGKRYSYWSEVSVGSCISGRVLQLAPFTGWTWYDKIEDS